MALRVAMACARFPPHVGGTETHVAEVSRRLVQRGIEVTVLTTGAPGAPAAERRDGVEIRRFRRYDRGDWYVAPGLGAALARERFDLLHVQGVHTAVPPLSLPVALGRGMPTVLTFHTGGHSGPLRHGLRDLQWRALRPLLRRVDRLVAVCEYEIESFSRTLGLPLDRFVLVRNGSDRLPVDPGPPAVVGRPLVLSIGRLERYKGHHRLVAALAELRKKAPEAHLAIVGRGPYEEALRQQVASLRLESAVSFTAFDPGERAQLGSLVAQADAVALLSDYEAHPVAVTEALGLGVPVVVGLNSGMSELARSGLAGGVDVDAPPAEVAEALLAAAARPNGCAVSLPSWDDCAEALGALYHSLVAG